jgi:hypothetical protein
MSIVGGASIAQFPQWFVAIRAGDAQIRPGTWWASRTRLF